MAKLENMWINHKRGDNHELRLDWSNDRHLRVDLDNLSPESVQKAFVEAADILRGEMLRGEI